MGTAAARVKVGDIPPTTLRLDPEVRDTLMREATLNGRSLSKEIEQRLRDSLAATRPPSIAPKHGVTVLTTGERHAPHAPTPTDAHRQLTALFDAMTPDKQLALLTLLRR